MKVKRRQLLTEYLERVGGRTTEHHLRSVGWRTVEVARALERGDLHQDGDGFIGLPDHGEAAEYPVVTLDLLKVGDDFVVETNNGSREVRLGVYRVVSLEGETLRTRRIDNGRNYAVNFDHAKAHRGILLSQRQGAERAGNY